jgi:nitrite reductase/ring-hydroxylating ferredoxin subunit
MANELAQKGATDQETRGRAARTKGRVRVGLSDEVPERGRLVVDIDDNLTIGIFRIDGELYAYQNTCAHQGGPVCQGRILPRVVEILDTSKEGLGQRWDETDMHIICPWHGFEYSIKTGKHAGDCRIHLRSFRVSEDAGVIDIEI